MGAFKRMIGAVGSRSAAPAMTERKANRSSSPDTSPQHVTSVRVYRQAPAFNSLTRGSAPSSPYELTSGAERRRADGPSTQGGRGGPAGQHAAGAGGRLAAAASPTRNTSALNLARARSRSGGGDGRRTISVSTAGVVPAGGSSSSGSRGTSAETKKIRQSRRPQPSSSNDVRYEPRIHTHSASLREGPPKGQRARRKSPSQQQRRFREYSAVTKDGVTLHVPTRR
jgi:hypothetical protein